MSACYCDYEQPEFFSKVRSKARIQHKCSECHSAIAPGEVYENVRGKWDGDFSVFKMCPRCIAFRDHISAHVPCFCWSFGGLLEDARYEIEALPDDARGSGLLFELGRMAVAIKHAPKFQPHAN